MVYIRNLFNENWPCFETPRLIEIYKLPKGPRITLPQNIELNEELAWLIGFYLAEGNKNCYYGIGISNCNIELLIYFQEIMKKYFLINKNEWSVYIKTSNKNLDLVKERWEREIEINSVNVNFNELAREDLIELRLNNTLLSILFNRFIQSSMEAILNKKELTLEFLNGYEVGDGSIIQRRGYLYGIAITTGDETHKNILVNAFQSLYQKKPHVRINKGKYYEVSLTGINLMTEIILDGHFKLHKEKRSKLIRTYLCKIYTRSHKRYWEILKNRELSVEELTQESKRSHWAVRDAMNRDFKLDLINIRKGRIPNKHGPYHVFYSLTEKCNNLLNILDGDKM